jgi:dihydrofolate reductase
LVLKVSVSVDGFMAGPGGEIDWIFRSMDDAAMDWIADTLDGAGLHIMGSRTWQDMAAYWPHSSDRLAGPMNRIPKVVFSRQPGITARADQVTRAFQQASAVARADGTADAATLLGWTQPQVASGELSAEITRLKREPGRYILAHGGASFASSLVASGLVDELRLVIHPVVLGKGLGPFAAVDRPLDLTLCSSTRFKSGVVANVYRPAGRPAPSTEA